MREEILEIVKRNGLLLEKEIFDLVSGIGNSDVARSFLEQLERVSGQKIITKSVLSNNVEYVRSFVGKLPGEDKNIAEKVFINFGLSLEVRREKEVVARERNIAEAAKDREQDYTIIYADTGNKKLEVKDFTGYFRTRFQQLQRILLSRPELQSNLVSIGKISSDRTTLSIIGIATEKRITKNKNMIITFEDLTGKINALVKFDRSDIFEKADELQLDDVIGVKASGNKDLLFVHDIFYPDAFVPEKTRFDNEVCVAFLSDLHCGSDRHLGGSFFRFLEWIMSDHEIAKKVKYIFFSGDNVDGVGIFPGQEDVLYLKSMEEQYMLLASYLRKIPTHITMFMCPGQHDACRVAEPQPLISRKYASCLYEIEHLHLVTNPAMVKLIEGEKEFKILMYHGASIHTLINGIKSLRLMKAHRCPAKAVKEMLKRRHLSPTHGSMTGIYIPNAEKDPLVVSEVPDVLCTGEVHRLDIENHNGVLVITGSCWQAQTSFEEKVGNIPDPCKVPVLNLKTRELRIFDFTVEEEVIKDYGCSS